MKLKYLSLPISVIFFSTSSYFAYNKRKVQKSKKDSLLEEKNQRELQKDIEYLKSLTKSKKKKRNIMN